MQWNSFDKDLRLRIFWKKGHFYDPTDNNSFSLTLELLERESDRLNV